MKRDRQLIERFWTLRRSVRFSSTETVLYLALVRLCRDAGWPPALLCPNAALCREAGIDESTLVRARHALIRKGVIGYAGTTAGSHRTCYVLSPLPVSDSGAALPALERTGPSATGRDSAGLERADCGMPDRSESERGAARPAPAAKRRAGIGRESSGTDRAENERSDQPVSDSGAAHNSSQARMDRDSAGLRSDRPDESAVGNRARNPRAEGTEAGEPDTPTFAQTDSGSASATPSQQPRSSGKPQNPGATARQKGGTEAAHRRIGAVTEAPGASETGPTGTENSGRRCCRTVVTARQAGKGAGKEGDYGGDREEERDYPSNGIDHKPRNGWETYRPGNGDVAGEEAGAAILPDLLPDILPDLRADNRHEKRSDTSLEIRADSRAETRPDTRQDTIPDTSLDTRQDSARDTRVDSRFDARTDSRAETRPDTRQDTIPETPLDTRAANRHDSSLDGRDTRRPKTGTNAAQPATASATGSGGDTACRSEQADGRVSASGKGAVRKSASAPAVTANHIPHRFAGPGTTRCGTAAAEEAACPTRCPAQTAAAATAECENPMTETGGAGVRSEKAIAEKKRPEYRAGADRDEVVSSDRSTAGTTGSTAKRIPHRFAGPGTTRCGTAAAKEAAGCGTVRADDDPVWCAVEEATRSDIGAARSGSRSTQTDIRTALAGSRAPQLGNPAAYAVGMTVRSAGAGRESVAQADGEPTQAAPAVGVAGAPTKRRRRVRAELDLSFVGQDFLTPFGEWLAYKRGRGNGYRTQASLEACYQRLLHLSDGDPARAREVVRQSIANNWSGIFELRQNHANHYPIAPAHAGAVPRTAVPPHTDGYTDTL